MTRCESTVGILSGVIPFFSLKSPPIALNARELPESSARSRLCGTHLQRRNQCAEAMARRNLSSSDQSSCPQHVRSGLHPMLPDKLERTTEYNRRSHTSDHYSLTNVLRTDPVRLQRQSLLAILRQTHEDPSSAETIVALQSFLDEFRPQRRWNIVLFNAQTKPSGMRSRRGHTTVAFGGSLSLNWAGTVWSSSSGSINTTFNRCCNIFAIVS